MADPDVNEAVGGSTGVMSLRALPYVQVEGDMADPRLYSEEEIESRIEAFLSTF